MSAVAEVEPAKRGVFADRRVDWGFVASALMHIVGIAVAGIWFSDARSFEEAQEAIPIEVVTQADLNQVTQGEKEAPAAPKPAVKAEREAPRVVKPEKPVEKPEERDVPTPPPPPIRQAEPQETPVPTPPPAPPRVAMATPEPPPRPQPAPIPAPPTPPHRPAPEPEPKDAEAIPAPEPPRRPVEPPRKPVEPRREARVETRSDDMPTPPPRPRVEAKALPKPEARPEARPDQLAKLIEAKRAEERARPDETQPSRFNAADVRAAISRERPQQRAAAAPQPAQTAALGSPTARAERMSPSMWGQLDGYLQEQYRGCWNKFGFDGQTYIPQIRVLFNPDGSLAAEPVLVNAPGDAAERSLADSAMRAVRRCDPIKIPPQYAPYHAQWKARTLRFDPQEM